MDKKDSSRLMKIMESKKYSLKSMQKQVLIIIKKNWIQSEIGLIII